MSCQNPSSNSQTILGEHTFIYDLQDVLFDGRYNVVSRDRPTKLQKTFDPLHPGKNVKKTKKLCGYGHAFKNGVVGLDRADIFRMDDMIIAIHMDKKRMKSGCSIFVFLTNWH